MSTLGALRYRAMVDLLGHAALRLDRLRTERRLARMRSAGPNLGPPLRTGGWLKELISRHYLAGRYADQVRKVAWVTSGAPIEHLKALGYYLLYPENHGAVCGIRRWGERLCQRAEDAGYSRDLCSYARTDFGTVLSGQTPVGRLPRPDLLLCCTNICQTVLYWYQVLAHHFRVPLVLIDTPFVYTEARPHMLAYVRRQIEASVEAAERVAGRSLAPARLEEVMRRSHEAIGLWLAVMQTGRHRPAPITAFDEFIHMAPIVEMRGDESTVAYYRALLAELEERARRGVGALAAEKKRLLWDNLPIWFRIRPLSEALAARGVALVASTYTNAWGELVERIDPSRPLDSMADVYLHPILNRGTGHKLATMARMVEEYKADGVLLHSDRSCKPYSVGQMDQQRRLAGELGVPALLLDADHNDPRAYTEEQAENRLQAFLEVLGA